MTEAFVQSQLAERLRIDDPIANLLRKLEKQVLVGTWYKIVMATAAPVNESVTIQTRNLLLSVYENQ